MVSLARAICGVSLVLVVAGGAGALHPAGDSLAVFGGALALIAALGLPLARWPRAVTLVAVVVILAALVPRAAGWAGLPRGDGAGQGAPIVVYQKNMLYRSADRSALRDDIRRTGAQAVLLQEVSGPNETFLAELAKDMPTRHLCPFRSVTGGVAIASALPRGPEAPICAEGMAALQVMTAQGPLWLVSLHLYWPWPMAQSAQVAGLLPGLAALDGPVVVGGDFNAVPRTTTLRRLTRATGTTRAPPVRPSFRLPYIPMGVTIDHLLVPRGAAARAERRPLHASDHRGLVVRLQLSSR